MVRPFIILATIFSLLFGTGAFNIACLCDAAASCSGLTSCNVSSATSDDCAAAPFDADQPLCCCDAVPGEHPPHEAPMPGQGSSEQCPCLYWTSVPFSTTDTPTGPSLVKRALEVSSVLLLEAVSAPLVHGTAATIRAGSPSPRDMSVRLQAWHCVWTI